MALLRGTNSADMTIKDRLADIAFSIALTALALLPFVASANDGRPGFMENKGQIHDQFRKPNATALFLLNTPWMNVQLKHDGFAYDTYAITERDGNAAHMDSARRLDAFGLPVPEPTTLDYQFHRIDPRSVNGNAEIIVVGQSED